MYKVITMRHHCDPSTVCSARTKSLPVNPKDSHGSLFLYSLIIPGHPPPSPLCLCPLNSPSDPLRTCSTAFLNHTSPSKMPVLQTLKRWLSPDAEKEVDGRDMWPSRASFVLAAMVSQSALSSRLPRVKRSTRVALEEYVD